MTTIPESAVGFMVYRFNPDTMYTGIEFLNGFSGCEIFYRRMKAFGYISDQVASDGVVDVIDSSSDTIESFYVTAKGLRYLYKKLNLRVVRCDA